MMRTVVEALRLIKPGRGAVLGVVFATVMSVLAACGSSTGAGSSGKVLKVWWYEAPGSAYYIAWNQAIKDFEKEHPGVRVQFSEKSFNQMQQTAPMVLLDLPIPPGFAIDADDLAALVTRGTIAKYQLNPRSAIVYLRSLEPDKSLTLQYHLGATMPVKVTVPAAKAYEYYDTDKQGRSKTTRLTVTGLR